MLAQPGKLLATWLLSTSLNSVFIDPNNFNFLQRYVLWPYRPHQNLGQIDHNLHNHAFDDVICKPPTDFDSADFESASLYQSVILLKKIFSKFDDENPSKVVVNFRDRSLVLFKTF